MATITLARELLDYFNITEYSRAKIGGQKTVFKVRIEGVFYALKIINLVDQRFEREVKICSQYSESAGIPKILRIEQFEGFTIILEEFIEGSDLSEIYQTYRGDERKVCELLSKISRILYPVWNDSYVHRDLKPQNIRIRTNGEPVVLDFGIARALNEESITGTGQQPFSPLFASPEQIAGKKKLISYRTDFFCLAIMGFYLYTNEYPFGNNQRDIENLFRSEILPISIGSHVLQGFCNANFKINPSERPRTPESFFKLLEL